MPQKLTRRGRPKGTGIDDSDRIQRLVELLRNQPDLRPTTAIRVMGFNDPSAIRRLRDKYKVFANIGREMGRDSSSGLSSRSAPTMRPALGAEPPLSASAVRHAR